MARVLGIEELITLLVKEHEKMRGLLTELHDDVEKGDYAKAASLLLGFDPYLKQHILDEEARVLRMLLAAYGRQGADEAIRVFQEHRTIHQLLNEMQELAAKSPSLLKEKGLELDRLLREHFGKEERRIFPWTLDTHRREGK